MNISLFRHHALFLPDYSHFFNFAYVAISFFVPLLSKAQKFIAESGYCSRRKAEELILHGQVIVNGKVIRTLGTKVDGNDNVVIEGIRLEKQDKEYYVFYKPRGVVTTTSDDKHRDTVMDYFDTNKRLYPVGRLDYDTTGILLITNDGEFTNNMMHPKNEIEKVYIAKVEGILDGESIRKLKNGVNIEGVLCTPDRVKLKDVDKSNHTSIVEIIIHEGKNHEVKKMFESVGFNVLKLKRERIGFLTLEGLTPGEYRKLKPKEIKQLYSLIK
jgi:23S rRNA pseudouridine2605 synthase